MPSKGILLVRGVSATLQACTLPRSVLAHASFPSAALNPAKHEALIPRLSRSTSLPPQHQAFRQYHRGDGRDRKDSASGSSRQGKTRPKAGPTRSKGVTEPGGHGRDRQFAGQGFGRFDGPGDRKPGQKRKWWERSLSPPEKHNGQDPALRQFAKGDFGNVQQDQNVKQPPKALPDWFQSVRANFKELQDNPAPPARASGAAGALAGIPKSATAAEALTQLLPPRQDDGLRPLDWPPSANPTSGPARFDPRLLPDLVRVFQRASARLHFTTQLPSAVAAYVVAASQRGVLDLAAFDVSVCKALVLYLGQAHVVNRDFLEQLRKALRSRWPLLAPEDLVEVLVGLKRLNDADRLATVGRPGAGSSRLLRMMLDAEPSVMAMLQRQRRDSPGPSPGPGRGTVGTEAAAAAAASATGGGGGESDLPSGAAVKLALAYLSFYMTATSGHQHFAIAPMLLATLEACLARLDPSDARQVPADELGRLVAGIAGVALLPSHQLAGHLQRFAQAATERFAEMSQPSRALLLDLPAQHWALPPGWRDRAAATVLPAKCPGGMGVAAVR